MQKLCERRLFEFVSLAFYLALFRLYVRCPLTQLANILLIIEQYSMFCFFPINSTKMISIMSIMSLIHLQSLLPLIEINPIDFHLTWEDAVINTLCTTPKYQFQLFFHPKQTSTHHDPPTATFIKTKNG